MAEADILDRYTESDLEDDLPSDRLLSASERLDRFRDARTEVSRLGRHREANCNAQETSYLDTAKNVLTGSMRNEARGLDEATLEEMLHNRELTREEFEEVVEIHRQLEISNKAQELRSKQSDLERDDAVDRDVETDVDEGL